MTTNRSKLLLIIEIAVFTALAFVLDKTPFLKFTVWPNGGSVSFAMIPIFIVAFRWGLPGGLLSGFLFGLLKLSFGGYFLHIYQVIIEYGFAYTVLGFAGLFSSTVKQSVKNNNAGLTFLYVTLGTLVGAGLRYLAHFYAGIAFWASSTPEDMPVWLFSLIYNGTYMLPSFVICAIGISLLFKSQPRTLLQ